MSGEMHGTAQEAAGPGFVDVSIRAMVFAVLDELSDGEGSDEVTSTHGVDDGTRELGGGFVHVEAFTVDPAAAEGALGGEDVAGAEVEQVARDLIDGRIEKKLGVGCGQVHEERTRGVTLDALPHKHEVVLGTDRRFRVEDEAVLRLQDRVEQAAVLLAVVESEAGHDHEGRVVDRVELLLVEPDALGDGMLDLALDAVLLLREAEASRRLTFAKRAEGTNAEVLERFGEEFCVVVLPERPDQGTRVAKERKLAGNTERRTARAQDAIVRVPSLELFDDGFANDRDGCAEPCCVVSSCSECGHAWILTRSGDGMFSRGAHRLIHLAITMVLHRHPWTASRLAAPGKADEPHDTLAVPAPRLKQSCRREVVADLAAQRPRDVPGEVVVTEAGRVWVAVGALGHLGRRPHADPRDAAEPSRDLLTPPTKLERPLEPSCRPRRTLQC